MTFKNYLASQGKSKSTLEHYQNYLLDFLSHLDGDDTDVDNASAKEVLSYLSYLQKKGQQNQTRSIRLTVIKHFFNWQIEQGQRIDNPAQHLKIRGTKSQSLYPLLSKQELAQLPAQYKIPQDDDPQSHCNWFRSYQLTKQRNQVILSLLVHQGLTTSEISRLETQDLVLKAGQIYIRGSRSSNERRLELQSRQIMELMDYQYHTRVGLASYQNEESKRLFLSAPTIGQQKAKPAEQLQIWKGLSKAMKQQTTKFINFRQVRASVITHWLKQYNLRQVQYMAGHRYVSSTEAYLVNQIEDLQKDIDQYHPF